MPIESEAAQTSYQVVQGFMLNLGDVNSRKSFKVIPGDILKFDGFNVYYGGIKGEAPTLRAVIREGWLAEVEVTVSAVSKKQASAVKASQALTESLNAQEDVVTTEKSSAPNRKSVGQTMMDTDDFLQKPTAMRQKIHSSSPDVPKATVTSTDDQITVQTRAGKASSNNVAPVAAVSQQQSTRGKTVIMEESRTVSAIRAQTGAASPGKAVALGKIASDGTVLSPASQGTNPGGKQPPTRERRPAVQQQEDSMVGSRRASASSTTSKTLLDGTDTKLGVEDYQEAQSLRQANSLQRTGKIASPPEPQTTGQGRNGNGGRATKNNITEQSKDIGDQSPSAVYKGRRATPAVSNTELAARPAEQRAPKPIRAQAELVDLTDINGGIIVSSTRSVKASSESGGITTRTTVGGNSGLVVPKATVSSANNDSVIMSKGVTITSEHESDIYDPDNYLGVSAAPTKKNASVIDDNTVDPTEEDYSGLNLDMLDDPDLVNAVNGPKPPVPEVGEVASNYLTTVMVGGLPWAQGTIGARTKYINDCRNLSILALIAKDSTLQPSVKKIVVARLELLSVGT